MPGVSNSRCRYLESEIYFLTTRPRLTQRYGEVVPDSVEGIQTDIKASFKEYFREHFFNLKLQHTTYLYVSICLPFTLLDICSNQTHNLCTPTVFSAQAIIEQLLIKSLKKSTLNEKLLSFLLL